MKIAVVASCFNSNVCEGLLKGSLEALKEGGVQREYVDVFRVPGAFEISLAAKKCAISKKYRGVICLGAVIRGETPHFDYICQATAAGILQVSLDTGIPVGFGVITTNTLEQAVARSSPDEYNKGREAAFSVIEMMDLLHTMSA